MSSSNIHSINSSQQQQQLVFSNCSCSVQLTVRSVQQQQHHYPATTSAASSKHQLFPATTSAVASNNISCVQGSCVHRKNIQKRSTASFSSNNIVCFQQQHRLYPATTAVVYSSNFICIVEHLPFFLLTTTISNRNPAVSCINIHQQQLPSNFDRSLVMQQQPAVYHDSSVCPSNYISSV